MYSMDDDDNVGGGGKAGRRSSRSAASARNTPKTPQTPIKGAASASASGSAAVGLGSHLDSGESASDAFKRRNSNKSGGGKMSRRLSGAQAAGNAAALYGSTNTTMPMQHTQQTFATSAAISNKGGKGSGGGGGGGPYDHLPEYFRNAATPSNSNKRYLQRNSKTKSTSTTTINPQDDSINNTNYLIMASNNMPPPQLYFLPKLLQDAEAEDIDFVPLDALLRSADEDVRLHRARVMASVTQDPKLLRSYQLETDPMFQACQQRLAERHLIVQDLQQNAANILAELQETQEARGLTQAERTAAHLQKWQRALELYVHSNDNDKQQQQQQPADALDWHGVFEKLLVGIGEEQDISSILKEASDMCEHQVAVTQRAVSDAAAHLVQVETSYRIRLEAHQQFARYCLVQVGDIEDQFKSSGKAALQIGHQLQHAELKRRQCEAASTLIRRWWMLETLAEQEHASGVPLDVRDEVVVRAGQTTTSSNTGAGPKNNRMDPLFTQPQHSLEASACLKQLRAIVRSRGSAAGGGGTNNKNQARFDATASLVHRTSDALEERLFSAFVNVYKGGTTYDFSSKPRPGSIDWRELRALAQALLLFDNARHLHHRYVSMVVAARFPELFQDDDEDEDEDNLEETKEEQQNAHGLPELPISPIKKRNDDDKEGGDADGEEETGDETTATTTAAAPNSPSSPRRKPPTKKKADTGVMTEMEIDETRGKLSSLFHRVTDVCTAEFELISKIFGHEGSRTNLLEGNEEMPLVVARALLQRVVSDPRHGLQARINHLLANIDKLGDFEAGSKKLDTFVVIHEKAAGLFGLLREAASNMVPDPEEVGAGAGAGVDLLMDMDEEDEIMAVGVDQRPKRALMAARAAIESLKGFLTSQELALVNSHRQSYINLELRLLHHECCNSLDQAGCTLVKGPPPRPNKTLAEQGILEEYRAPVLPLHKESLLKEGLVGLLSGPLKQSVLRQPLIRATDSLSRTRMMFGTNKRGGETTSRVILGIYNQMCSFYGKGFLYPIVETLREMLPNAAPSQPPQLPFDEEVEAPDLGVPPAFWICLERIHSASKSFDRELWAQGRADSARVWETLQACGDAASIAIASEERVHFYAELERRGEAAILQTLDTLSAHISWVLVTGGESMLATGGTRIFNQLTGTSGGPYAIPTGASLETPNSPAVKSLTYCLRVQFVHVQSALTAASLAKFWTALSMRLYDILVARLLQHYFVSTVGAVILSRDVEALRSVAMLAGTEHQHWDTLRELLTLYMTPPDAIKLMLTGAEGGDSSKGLFAKAGRDQCLVFMSRRNDYRYKTAAGLKKSGWVTEMLSDLNMSDPTDGPVNIGLFAAGRTGYS